MTLIRFINFSEKLHKLVVKWYMQEDFEGSKIPNDESYIYIYYTNLFKITI